MLPPSSTSRSEPLRAIGIDDRRHSCRTKFGIRQEVSKLTALGVSGSDGHTSAVLKTTGDLSSRLVDRKLARCVSSSRHGLNESQIASLFVDREVDQGIGLDGVGSRVRREGWDVEGLVVAGREDQELGVRLSFGKLFCFYKK